MKIGLFVPTHRRNYNKVSASIWIRVLQMKAYYEMLGMTVSINNPFQKYDIAILYRLPTKNMYRLLQLLKFTSKKTYYDVCVNYFELHEKTNELQVEINNKMAKEVDGIICSTEEISKRALKYNNNVQIIDDPLNFSHFKYIKKNINFDDPVYGWSGISHKAHAIENFRKEINNLLIISEKKPDINMKFRFVKWRYESFPYLLSKIDIAFLPRENIDNNYNIGHSSFKALVFASEGIPIIANKIPSYEKLALFYDGIVFLEDYLTFQDAKKELSKRSFAIDRLQDFYSCENQAFKLLRFIGFFNE